MTFYKNIMFNKESFCSALLRWFAKEGRDLPWRRDYDPYHIWLSEIMLQQTQMERGVSYFECWIDRFPSVEAVAEAPLDEILKLWEGLGYYARARNLHRAAIEMTQRYQGKVPDTVEALRRLPGVGRYTAAAVASIAYQVDVPVVDANVERVFARIFDIDTPVKDAANVSFVHEKAISLLPIGKSREFNQALMELGALICSPKNPDCGVCPISRHCLAYARGVVEQRPVKGKKESIIPIEMVTGILVHKGALFIQQRQNDDVWGGLWEFPGGKIEEGEGPEEALLREYMEETAFRVMIDSFITTVVHHYTRYRVSLHCFCCSLQQTSTLPDLKAAQKYHWIDAAQLENYAFPAGHRKCLDYINEHCPRILYGDK